MRNSQIIPYLKKKKEMSSSFDKQNNIYLWYLKGAVCLGF